MTDGKEKIKFRESLKLLGFGVKTAHKLAPAFFPCVLLRSLITAIQPLAVLYFSARILNQLGGARDTGQIIIYVSLTAGITFFLSILKAVLVRAVEMYAGWEQALRRVDMAIDERFATMDFAHTEDSSVSEMLARMDLYARSSARGLIHTYIHFPQIADNLFSLIFAALLLTGPLAVSSMDGLPGWGIYGLYGFFAVGLMITLWLRSKEAARLGKIRNDSANINALANYYYEYVAADKAAKDIRFYKQSPLLMSIFEKTFSAKPWISFFNFLGHVSGFSLALMAAIGGGFYLLVGYAALGGAVPVGSIVQTVGAMTILTGAIGALIGQLGEFYNNAVFLEPMRGYLTLPDILAKGGKPLPRQGAEGYVFEFADVSFKYPSAEDYALKNINLKIANGERLAIVGLNGSGKTTLVKLLCRLYDPADGKILLNGTDIKEIDYAQYISVFSVVFQDFKLFPLSLGHNVAVSMDYDVEKAMDSLSRAGFSKRLESMPAGLETMLFKDYDEDGTTISGGEAQKIALARALYKDAPIVVLDEPTAALDPIAEYDVYTTFDKTIGDKTAVFISHRLSSCRFCHRIAVFDEGKLIQLGTHDELLTDSSSRYYELWDAQAGHYR